jgi:hypothetical protein
MEWDDLVASLVRQRPAARVFQGDLMGYVARTGFSGRPGQGVQSTKDAAWQGNVYPFDGVVQQGCID